MKNISLLVLLAAFAPGAYAQQETPQADTTQKREPAVFVNQEPFEAENSMSVITREQIERMPAKTIQEVLALILNVDIRQTNTGGAVNGAGIRGGNAAQTKILFNGINATNYYLTEQSLSALPVSLEGVEKIEVIRGSDTKQYGIGTIGGAINIITKQKIDQSNIRIEGYGGSQGMYNANVSGTLANKWSESYISLNARGADSDAANVDFTTMKAYLQTKLKFSKMIHLNLSGGFASNRFYSTDLYDPTPQPAYQRTNSVDLRAKLDINVGKKIVLYALFDYNYNFNLYDPQNVRNYPVDAPFAAYYLNKAQNNLTRAMNGEVAINYTSRRFRLNGGSLFHSDEIFSSHLERADPLKVFEKVPHQPLTFYKNKANLSYFSIFYNQTLNAKRFQWDLGVNYTPNSKYKGSFTAGTQIGFLATENLKIFVGFDMAARLPDFREVYEYTDLITPGGTSLKKEKANNFTLGLNYKNKFSTGFISLHYLSVADMIYPNYFSTKTMDDGGQHSVYKYINSTDNVNSFGLELSYNFDIRALWGQGSPLTDFGVRYAYNNPNYQKPDYIYLYGDYLKHNAGVNASFNFLKNMYLDVFYRYQQREGTYTQALGGSALPYGSANLIDAKLAWRKPRYEIFVTGNNLLDVKFHQYPYSQAPGLSVVGGIRFNVFK